MEAADVELGADISFLCRKGLQNQSDTIQNVILPVSSKHDLSHDIRSSLDQAAILRKADLPCLAPADFLTEEERTKARLPWLHQEHSQDTSLIVNGRDIGDFPTEYNIQGLRTEELPVIGTYVDKNIYPGFRYAVRVLGENRYLFNGQGLRLQGIGRGYGKRITFEGKSLNDNQNYFYSDSNSEGYGLKLDVLHVGGQFVVRNDENSVEGEGTILRTIQQREIKSVVDCDGEIVKHVAVSFECDVRYGSGKHGLIPLFSDATLQLSGVADVVKPKGRNSAFTRSVHQVELPNCGPCILVLSK